MRNAFIELAKRENRWYDEDFADITLDGKYRDGDLQFLWTVFQTGGAMSASPLIDALHGMLSRFDDSVDQYSGRVACAQARSALSLYVASQS